MHIHDNYPLERLNSNTVLSVSRARSLSFPHSPALSLTHYSYMHTYAPLHTPPHRYTHTAPLWPSVLLTILTILAIL